MRTIKFRGKDATNGEWLYGYYIVIPLPNEDERGNLLGYEDQPIIYNGIPDQLGKCSHYKSNNCYRFKLERQAYGF